MITDNLCCRRDPFIDDNLYDNFTIIPTYMSSSWNLWSRLTLSDTLLSGNSHGPERRRYFVNKLLKDQIYLQCRQMF